jgi:hypothetical protein
VPHGICNVENQNCRGIIIFNKGKTKGTPGWI